ncbi:MAG: hypothetical protein JWR01_2569 [Subtercola sp.]|nr:hypothetical protein [Subtercola sp.]
MGRLNGKAAIITGGAAGIGFAIAQLFLVEGANVMIVDRSAAELDRAVEALSAPHGASTGGAPRVHGVVADVSIEADAQNYVARALDQFGRLDILVNNAGIEGTVTPLVDTDLDQFRRVLDVNVIGVLLGLKHALPPMLAEGSGSIVNLGSVASFAGTAGLAAYVASKHAVVGLTKTAALEAAPRGVRVNSIHPSSVDTQMMRNLEAGLSDAPGEVRDRMMKAIPLGRYADPHDIALLALFLASDESRQITGAQYRIDGGRGAAS